MTGLLPFQVVPQMFRYLKSIKISHCKHLILWLKWRSGHRQRSQNTDQISKCSQSFPHNWDWVLSEWTGSTLKLIDLTNI